MSDWTPPADAKKVTPAASGWKPPSDAKKADGALFPSAPPASGEEGLGGPAVSRVPSTNGYAPQPRHLETGGLRPFKGLDAAAPRRPQMTPTALSPNRGTREDGTNKGPGWLGSIPAADGKEMTELSFDFDVDGKNIFAPLLVPTLSEGEVALLASGGEPTDAIYKKAQDFAIQRLDQGKSPFKEDPRSIVKKEKAEEIDLIGADRTTQQPSTIQAPQFDITPATAKQKKKAEEDARIEDRYQSEFSSATEEEVQKAKEVNQSMRSSIPAMEGAFLEGVERLKQQGQLLTDQRQILDNMDPSDPAYQGALDQYNERVKAFRKEQSGIELEALVVDDLVKKSAIDEFLLNRREHAIKAGHGNIPAAMGYASLDMLGKSMAGTLDVIGKVIPTDQEILEFAGALPEGSGTESRKEWRNYLKDVEKAPTRLTGIDQFVTPEYVDKKKDESLFAGGLIAVAEMAPAIAAGMATGGAGMGASFFTSSYRDLDQEMQGEYWDQIPEAEKEAIKVGTSFVSAGLSTMGMKALAGKLPVVNDIFFRAARKFAPGMSPGQLRRIIDAETKSYVANVASKIGQGFAIEGTEELADYGQEELVKHLYENYKRDELGEKADTLFQNAESIDQLGEGAWKSFVIGGIAGNMIGGSVAALSSVGARKRLSEKEFGVFKDLLESGSLLKDIEPIMAAQVAAGEMSQSDFDKTMEDVSKAESAISQIPEGLDIKATREAFDLLLEKDKLKTKDKILSAPKMQKIDEKLQALVGVPKEEEAKTEPTKKKAGTPDTPSKTVEWEGKDVQPKEQVTTPNENEQPSVNRGGSDPVVSNTETNVEATPASVPEGTGVGKNVETTAPPDTAPPTSVQDEAPKPVAKKEAPSPGQGEGTTKSPYHSTSGKKYGGFSVTYDPEIGKMKTTMLGTPPPSGAEKFPAGSKERAKKSSNRIKAIRKARQEAEDELARKLGIAKDGRFERGSNALEKREEEKERRAAISKKADRLDEDALGVYGVVLRVMADGDMKITPESIAKYLGWGGGRNDGAMAERRKTEEETKASWTLDDGGEHINNAAHGMMEGSTMKDADGDPMDGWSEADFAEAIAQVASGYTSSHEAYVQLERMADDLTEATLSPEDAITAHENAILNGLMEDADVEGNLDAAQASILNMSEAQLEAQYQDYLNTQRDENQEDTDGNDNQGAADSALGEQDDSGEEGASTVTVTEEDQDLADRISKLADDLDGPMAQRQSPERTALESAVSSAQKALDKALKDINKRGQSLFSDQEGTDQTSIGDAFDGKETVTIGGKEYTEEEFDKAFVVHIDSRAGSENRTASIMSNGLNSGQAHHVDKTTPLGSLGKRAMARGWGLASGNLKPGTNVYVIRTSDMKSKSSPDIMPGTVPVAHVVIQEQDQSPFEVLAGLPSKPIGGTSFDNSTENYDRILGPLRARLAKAKAALAKYDKDKEAGDAAQGSLFQQKPTTLPSTITIDGKKRSTTNSKGQPIGRNEQEVRNFYEWFGDSKVVDERGRPLVMYHGTNQDFSAFDKESIGSRFDYSFGFHLTNRPEEAGIYADSIDNAASKWKPSRFSKPVKEGASVMALYVRAETPLDIKTNRISASMEADANKGEIVSRLVEAKRNGNPYDSVIIETERKDEWFGNNIIVFDPTQIKSATGNYGTFDPSKPSILEQKPTDTKPTKTGKLRTDRVAAALKKLVPNLEIIAPKTKEEYAEATKDISEGLGSTWGIYDPRTNKLYLNPSSPDLRQTFFHEAAHPIIIALAKNKPELFSKFYEQIRTEKGGKYIKFGQQYSDLSEAAQMAEALAEFFGDVAAGKVPVSTKPDSLYQQFKNFIKDILAALGWDMRSIDLSKPTDVRQFAAQMKKAFDKGIAIEGFAPLEGNKEAKVALQDDADRLVDGWYSRLDQAVAAKGNTQSGSDWLKWAEARAKEGMLSMEEVRWTGLAEFLDGKNKVTSQEVRDFLKENRVKVEVVEKGGEKERVPLSWTDVELSNGSSVTTSDTGGWSITDAGMGKVDLHGPSGRSERFESKEEAIRRAETPSPTSDTKFSQYQLPGGTNYREVLVTLPKRGASQAELEAQAQEQYGKPYTELNDAQQINTLSYVREARKDPEFRSSHFDEPNILVHLRVNDRTDADGKKVLFMEELQSDWGQQGKKEGFRPSEAEAAAIRAEWDTADSMLKATPEGSPNRASAEARYTAAVDAYNKRINDAGTPQAPFVTDTNSWVELGLKQAIRMAVDGGYDRIAWTNGEQQNERYDLSKQVDTIEYHPSTNTLSIWAVDNHSTRPTQVEVVEPERLDDYVGKDVANRLLEQPLDEKKKVHSLSGVDLKVGGSGMKGFYDKILPNVAKKVSKKLGGDGVVGETSITNSSNNAGWDVYQKSGDVYSTNRSKEDAKALAEKIGGTVKPTATPSPQQSIAITPSMRERVGLGVPLMQRPYGPIPADAHKAALNAVAASVRAGEGLSKAITNGLKEVRKSDWYKALDATQQAQAEADFKAPIKALATPVDKKPSTAPKKLQKQVMKAAGKKPAPKIVVNEKAALKDQIRMAAKNIRGERTRIAAARKEFVAAIKEAFKGSKGDFTAKQAAVVAHRAASVDPTNDLQVSRFLDYANKVIDNAEWADQVERADIMRGRAAKASKRKSVPYNHKEVLKQASEVDPAMLDNPGEYADIVQRYLGNIASPLSPQYAGTEQITEGEFQKYLSEWEAQMDQKYEDLLMDELGITVKKGQAKEIYKSIQEGTIDEALRQMDDPELKAEIESRVREMSQQRIAALKQHDTSGLDKEEVRIVKDIASADIDRLTVAQQADIIRASDNIILNNGFGGATLAASIASASNAVKPALDIAAKSGMRRALGIAQEFFSQSDAWTFFFGQAKDVGRIQNLVGFGDYVRGKAEFMKEQKKVRQDMEQFFSRLRAKYKDADSFENMTAEWVAGWVIQAMPKLNPKQSFEANKAMLQEDINRKMPTKSKKEAEMAQTVFDKIIAPANTREEALALLAKNYPSAKQSIDFMVNLFKPYRDRIQANSVRTWNMSGDYSDPYYLPKAFFKRGAKSLDVEPYSNKKNLTTMRPGQAGGTKARMTYRSLAENRLISPNIRNNVFSSLSDDLYGVATDSARMRLNEFMKMPDSNGVFGTEENKGFMAAMMHNYITAQDKSSGDQSEIARWVNNRINDARSLASVQALAGFTQITRQLPEAVMQASVMMGRDFPLLFKNIPEVTVPSSPEGQGAANLMGNYAIGSREHAKAGMAWEGKVNSLNNAFQKAMQSGRVREAMKIRAKIQEVFMWSLMKGDLLSARAAWLGFYEKARKMDGHEVESWQTEASMHEGDASRQDAALYADTMVNRMTVSSDPAQAARIAQRTKSPTANAFKALVQAFVGTAIQQVGRRYAEVSTLGGYAYKKATGEKTGEAYDPKRALMSLVAGTTGNAVFLGSRLLIASALRDAIGELYKWAVDDDDDDEEPSTKAKAIFGFMTALYMGGMMDSDIFRAIDKAERERGRKPKDPESESVKKYKLFKSQMLSEFIGSSIWQIADDAFIDGLNRMAYSAALDAGEPSAFTKGGDPKPFRTWLQDPKNAPFYRYGQTKFVDRDRWIPDLDDAGILGVFTKNAGYMLRNINNIFGDEKTEYKNEYQKAVKDIREASKERTEKASDIVARYEAGELTKEQSNKEFEKAFKDLPKDEYNKAARAFLDKRRYADAPDNVKEVLDINSVPVRVKMVRDMRSTMNAAEKKAFDSELRKANVMTDSFLKEYKSVKK